MIGAMEQPANTDADRRTTSRLWILFVAGALLGLLWERVQFRYYVHEGGAGLLWSHVSFAAVANGLLLVLIYLLGWLRTRDDRWHVHPRLGGYLLIIAIALAFTLASEILGLSVVRRWTYAAEMPLIPGLQVGLLPLAGAAIIALVVLRLTALTVDRRH